MPSSGLYRPIELLSENKRNRKNKEILGLCRWTKNEVEHESNDDISCSWCTWKDHKQIGKGTGRIRNQKNRHYPNYSNKTGLDWVGNEIHCELYKKYKFSVPADHRIKLKKSEKKDMYLDLARELKKTMEHEGDNYTNCDWCF